MSEEKKEKKISTLLLIILCIIPFVIIFGIWDYYGGHMLTGQTEEQLKGLGPGGRGDMYGGLNSLFTGFAFAGLIIALIFQTWELRLQREDMKSSLETQKKMTEIQKLSLEAQILTAEAQKETVNAQILIAKAQRITAEEQHNLVKAQWDSAEATRELAEATELSAELFANGSIAATLTEMLLILDEKLPLAGSTLELRDLRNDCLKTLGLRARELSIKRRTSKSPSTPED